MTDRTKLVLTFADANYREIVFIFDYADSHTDTSNIRALVDGIIENGSIFKVIPVIAKSAKFVSITDTKINLGN